MVRGIRGATTVKSNTVEQVLSATEKLLQEMIEKNNLQAEQVAQALISVTEDIDAAFPAAALRKIEGWQYVPVMCMREIPVPNSLQKCIRVMMTVNTTINQKEIQHIYLEEAVALRPDLRS